jgi:hypothetical protein
MAYTQTEIATKLLAAKAWSFSAIYQLLNDGNDRNTAVAVADAATYTVLNANNGRIHILPNFTATCTITLPTAAAGLRYRFKAKAVAADAQNWVIQANAAGALFLGGVVWLDNDSATDNVAGVFPDNSNDIILTVVTPDAGTDLEFYCDGTNWIVGGTVSSATTPAFS